MHYIVCVLYQFTLYAVSVTMMHFFSVVIMRQKNSSYIIVTISVKFKVSVKVTQDFMMFYCSDVEFVHSIELDTEAVQS